MTKKELEARIIEAIKAITPINGYGYKAFEDLRIAIAEAMGYETKYEGFGYYRHKVIKNNDDRDKVYTIIDGMKKKGIIKFSKSTSCFKLMVE